MAVQVVRTAVDAACEDEGVPGRAELTVLVLDGKLKAAGKVKARRRAACERRAGEEPREPLWLFLTRPRRGCTA